MARPRLSITGLGKLLARCDQPVYALDERREIVYVNAACARWAGVEAQALIGRVCGYHSQASPDGNLSAADGLCPPPEVFLGRHATATVACPGQDGGLSTRLARFIPLGNDETSCVGAVAIVSTEETAEPPLKDTAEQPSADQLHDALRRFRGLQAGRYHVDRLVGKGAAARRLRAQVAAAAASDANVLICGPPGSGREYLAKAIHYGRHSSAGRPAESSLYGGTLVSLPCPALDAELLQSTITALVRRAEEQHPPLPGTLVLADVDRLSAEAQSELAGFLEIAGFHLRIISLTAALSGELGSQDGFRRELALPLSTLLIEVPPLKERLEDLPLLAQMFLEEENARGEKQLRGFSSEALDQLAAYPFPGELDELARMVHEAHGRAEGIDVLAADLPSRIMLSADAQRYPRVKEEAIVLDEFLAEIETQLIRRALARAKGNKTKAAELLGMTRPRLYRRVEQLGLEEDAD